MIYLFNPSTEMALACGVASYTPTRSVADFERRNMLLPSLYASPGDTVLLMYDSGVERSVFRPFCCADIELLPLSSIRGRTEAVSPWGWNRALRQLLLRHGYAGDLPSETTLECWRMLAHRRLAARLNALIGVPEALLPREFDDVDEAMAHVERLGAAVLKMPWSSSGRGVLTVASGQKDIALKRIRATISSQKSVMVEPLFDRVCDFATEWESTPDGVRFLGYSNFVTDSSGRYIGNNVASGQQILDSLSQHTSREKLEHLPELLSPALDKLVVQDHRSPYYGPFGVDALIDSNGTIAPAVELNLRRTMGHVALSLQKRREEGFNVPDVLTVK